MRQEEMLDYQKRVVELFDIKSTTLNHNQVVNIEEKFKIGFTYFDVNIDVFAFLLDKNNKLISDDYVVFYNSTLRLNVKNRGADDTVIPPIIKLQKIDYCSSRPTDPEMAVIGTMEHATGAIPFEDHPDDQTWDFDLSRLNPDIHKIIIVANTLEKVYFKNLNLITRFYYAHHNKLECEYLYLPCKNDEYHTIEICSMYKEQNQWKLYTCGKKSDDICKLFIKYK